VAKREFLSEIYKKKQIKIMNMIVDKAKALKKWAPVLDSLKVDATDKREWMSEYAEMHVVNENVSYSTLNNLNGMGAVQSPVVGTTPGSVFQAGSGAQGSGDIAQNLLPVSMKIAAQTIGLDLVAVKPASSPRIELLFVDFKYDNNDGYGDEKNERPLVFKIKNGNDTNIEAMKADILNVITAEGVKETIGGLSERVFFHLSGGTSMAAYFNQTTYTVDANVLDEPTVAGGREGWLEFLGFSRIDGYPMFRTYRQVPVPATGLVGVNDKRNTFDTNDSTPISTIIADAALVLELTNNSTTAFNTGSTMELVSLLEDQIPGFVAGWDDKNPMNRDTDEKTYPGVIGPDIFTKAIQVGDIEISSALKRTQIEDIKASTGMDIVQKLESVLINELTQTISKQIVAKIRDLGEKNRVSHTSPKDGAGISKFDFDVDSYIGSTGFGPAPGGETTHSIQRKLVAKINNASNFIATDGRVGPSQYLVTNGNLASVIQDIAGYTINPVNAGKLNTNGQLYPMGNIGNIAIYVDPYMRWDDNRIFLGRKNSVDQPGLIFVPYLMAQSISLISEATWAPRMLIRSRYAIADIGFFPEKQFMAIEVTDTNGVLI
jgi:hypothetical protein